jgi:hypothetical protein
MAIGYSKVNKSRLLKVFLSRLGEMAARVPQRP